MSTVHPTATITPTKLEIARQWLTATDWFDGDADALKMGSRYSYRFDDPAGEVGVEVLLVADGERVLQVPLTYRSEELPEAEAFFLTHMEHSVLGRRWIYDGAGDPVLAGALVTAALTGARQQDFEVEVDGQTQVFPAVVQVHGTGTGVAGLAPPLIAGVERDGSTTRVQTAEGVLVLPHVAGDLELGDRPGLVGSWPDGPGEVVLAAVSVDA